MFRCLGKLLPLLLLRLLRLQKHAGCIPLDADISLASLSLFLKLKWIPVFYLIKHKQSARIKSKNIFFQSCVRSKEPRTIKTIICNDIFTSLRRKKVQRRQSGLFLLTLKKAFHSIFIWVTSKVTRHQGHLVVNEGLDSIQFSF